MIDPAQTPEPASGAEVRYGFEIAGLRLVPAGGVLTELVAHAKVFPVPLAAGTLAGVINLHGTIVPVVDPENTGPPGTDLRPQQRRALVFDREEQRVGVLLGAATPALLSLRPPDGPVPRPAGALARFLTRAWLQEDLPAVWWEFDHRAAFRHLAHPGAPATDDPSPAAAAGASTTEVIS
jgi:chemotaxis signal transduction protein